MARSRHFFHFRANEHNSAACTMSTDRSRRSSRRRSKRNSNEEEVLVVSKHLFTSKSSTCFTFGLNPANEAHKKVLCDGCDKVLSGRGGILTKEIREAKRDSVGINKQCHQPWHPKYAEHREHGKMVRYNDFSATRGKELQMKVLSDYLFQTASFMHNGIDHVKKEMKRNLKSSAATRRTAPRREDGDDTIVEAEQCAGVAISDLASIINAEVALHPERYLTEEDQESSGAQPTKVSNRRRTQ